MPRAPDSLPDDVDALKAALIETQAKLSGAQALIEHLQVAGFIYEYNPVYEIMRARHGAQIARDGTVVP